MKLMKQIVLISILAAAVASISFAASYGPERDKVLQIFQGPDEPEAQAAMWSKPDVFKVAVVYQGHRRDDYAVHACTVIHAAGLRGDNILVHVLDADKLKENEWAVIGEARCE